MIPTPLRRSVMSLLPSPLPCVRCFVSVSLPLRSVSLANGSPPSSPPNSLDGNQRALCCAGALTLSHSFGRFPFPILSVALSPLPPSSARAVHCTSAVCVASEFDSLIPLVTHSVPHNAFERKLMLFALRTALRCVGKFGVYKRRKPATATNRLEALAER